MTLHAEVSGSGPALVLLHGFTGSVATWEPARALLAARHRVVAIDLPGHGGSPPPDGRLPHVAHQLVETLDRLGVERAAWLGYSLGGRAALHVALAHPTRVDRLILESTSPGLADPVARTTRASADDLLALRLEREGLEPFVDAWMAQPLFATQRRLTPEVLTRQRALRLEHDPAGLAAALRALGAGRQAPLWDRLPTLCLPTLVLTGEDDHRYRAIGAAMTTRLPDARLAVIPDAGHTVHLENPVPFWSMVEAFLAHPIAQRVEGVAP
jgi:2-succinyl-6-hydroxy-2,4-cyclohexadiene-1-carboxylate synthase